MQAPHLLAAVGGVAALVLGAPAPALAADRSPSHGRVAETAAGLSWVEQDPEDTSGRPGNVHIGSLLLTTNGENADLFAGGLSDYDCAPGHVPSDPGADCRGVVHYEAATAAIRFAFDRRAGTAHVTGTVTFSDSEGEQPEQLTLPVDLHWAAEGRPVRSMSHHRDLSRVAKNVVHTRTLTWPTVRVQGTVGSLVLGDEPGDVAEHRLSHEETRVFTWTRPTGR